MVSYDRVRVVHTILYEDDDMEIIPLWSPKQLLRVLNTPAQWAVEAGPIRERQAARLAAGGSGRSPGKQAAAVRMLAAAMLY